MAGPDGSNDEAPAGKVSAAFNCQPRGDVMANGPTGESIDLLDGENQPVAPLPTAPLPTVPPPETSGGECQAHAGGPDTGLGGPKGGRPAVGAGSDEGYCSPFAASAEGS
jgi:hypothetical protein